MVSWLAWIQGLKQVNIFYQYGGKKFKMAEKVQNIRMNGYNSKTIEHNVMYNSLFESYYNWAWNYV